MRRMHRILDRVGATAAQRDQIRAVWSGLRPQLRAERTQHKSLRQQMVAALTAPTINAGEVERLRKLSMANTDKISALVTQGMVASAQVLTPDQRKLAQARDREGRRPPSLGPRDAVRRRRERQSTARRSRRSDARFHASRQSVSSAPKDHDLVARDLAVFWHPCSQMRDYVVFPPLIVTGARGVRLRLDDGREILDAISSWWCKALGHGHPRLAAALRAQQDAFEHVITANTTSAPLVRLCERLARGGERPAAGGAGARPRRPGGGPGHFGKVFLADNGSTAVEIALKMALQAQAQRGSPQRTRFVALENAYHGETAGTLSIGDLDLYAAPYRSLCFPAGRLTGLPYRSGPADPAWLDAGAEWPAIEAALDAQAGDARRDRLRTGASGGGWNAVLQPRSAAPVARLGRRSRRLSDRRRDRRRDGAAGRDPREPPGRRSRRGRPPPRCPTSRCCRRG